MLGRRKRKGGILTSRTGSHRDIGGLCHYILEWRGGKGEGGYRGRISNMWQGRAGKKNIKGAMLLSEIGGRCTGTEAVCLLQGRRKPNSGANLLPRKDVVG